MGSLQDFGNDPGLRAGGHRSLNSPSIPLALLISKLFLFHQNSLFKPSLQMH